MNHFDVGMHSLLGGSALLTSIFMVLEVGQIGFYISFAFGVVFFFAGIFFSRYQLNNKVKRIYTNFKLKDGMETQSRYSYDEKEGSESGEESNSQSEHSEQIIDIEPEDKPKKKGRKKHEPGSNAESGSGSGSGSEESSEEEGSEYDDNENAELFSQIEDISMNINIYRNFLE